MEDHEKVAYVMDDEESSEHDHHEPEPVESEPQHPEFLEVLGMLAQAHQRELQEQCQEDEERYARLHEEFSRKLQDAHAMDNGDGAYWKNRYDSLRAKVEELFSEEGE